jgi:hypothetical protein
VRGAEVSAVPELPGCRVNPAAVRFLWLEDWHRAEFRLQAAADLEGFTTDASVHGRISFYVEGLLAGELPIWTYIYDEAGAGDAEVFSKSPSASLFQAIFASYSHDDSDVVDTLSRAYRALGNTFLHDVETLRSGEIWDQRLLCLIEEADIFQLYWSEAAKRSPNVEKEWRHALAQARSTFIRPVYWRQPMPDPPTELAGFHFAWYALGSPGPGQPSAFYDIHQKTGSPLAEEALRRIALARRYGEEKVVSGRPITEVLAGRFMIWRARADTGAENVRADPRGRPTGIGRWRSESCESP